jgi:hypothetical protein
MMLATLTPAGASLTREMHAAMQRAQDRLLEALPAGERKRFLGLLLKLVDAIGPTGDPPPRPRRSGRRTPPSG